MRVVVKEIAHLGDFSGRGTAEENGRENRSRWWEYAEMGVCTDFPRWRSIYERFRDLSSGYLDSGP